MWLYDYKTEKDNPYRMAPFVQITHIAGIDNAPRWEYPWHEHESEYEVTYVKSGHGLLYIKDTPFEVKGGSLNVIPPGVHHRFCTEDSESLEYLAIRFREDGSEGELISFFRNLGSATTDAINYHSQIREFFRILLTIHQRNDGVADGMFQSVALGLLQWVRHLYENEALTLRIGDHYGIDDIREYIEKNKEKKITLDSLSYQFGISTSQLNRIFRKAYNTTPINYLITCRVTFATEYLLKTRYSVAEIGELVGYDNQNHFINMFTDRIGCTPDEYRRKNMEFPLKRNTED